MRRTNTLHKRGFSLVELAVSTSIIGILAALAIPAFKRTGDSTRIGAFEHDLRLYEQIFDTYELDNGYYPTSMPTPGVDPDDMEGRMSSAWKLPSPIGGTYRWVYTTEDDPADRSAYINIVHDSEYPIVIDSTRLEEIDQDIDDGDIDTGQLRIYGENIRFYVKF
jgi:prepilin-type N-terminal cleavage/methylation domain-containing protein